MLHSIPSGVPGRFNPQPTPKPFHRVTIDVPPSGLTKKSDGESDNRVLGKSLRLSVFLTVAVSEPDKESSAFGGVLRITGSQIGSQVLPRRFRYVVYFRLKARFYD
jgi:hypothetical protein